MKLAWIVGGFAVFCFASLLFARQGVVITSDGKRFEGDISDTGNAYEVVSMDPNRANAVNRLKIPKPAVKDIIYADNVGQAIKIEQGKLAPDDVNGRVDLAKWAIQNRAYEAARDVLEEAKKIDPNNKDVNSLLTTVYAQLHIKPGTPATVPAAADGAPAATQPTSSAAPKRMVTTDEINRIRQLEWNQKDPIRIRIDADARQKFLAGSGMSPAEFQRLPPEQQAIQILNNGKKDLAAGVHILSDPPSVSDFHKLQRAFFLPGCAAGNCHSGTSSKGGNFYLYNADTPAAIYTNFLTMQTFAKKIDVQRYLIDRQHPDGSLLLQYMLPPDVAETPHPPAGNYKGAVKIKNDPKFQQANNWVQSLNPVLPNYDIDLTTDAPKKEGAK